MPTPPLSDEKCLEAVRALKEHGGIKAYAAKALGLNHNTFDSRLKIAAQRGLMGFGPVLPGFRLNKTTTVLDADGNVQREFISQKPDVEGGKFNLPHGHVIKGVSAYLDGNGNLQGQWVKTKEGERSTEEIIDLLKSAFEGWAAPNIPTLEPGDVEIDTLTVYPLADMHLGLKAVADESGEDFDLTIAADRFRETTSRLFDRSPNSETALIVQLGDWTHVDDDLALTPASKNTLQVSDRLLDIIRCGVRIMIDYVYHALRKHRNVIVKVLKGNHDQNAWISLYVALREHFRDNERVTIDGGSADYWFFRFGTTLIGAHHGHRLKPEQMAGAMATECREDWGETLYRLFLHGHLHHVREIEVLGVVVTCMRTIASADQFHSGKYGSGKSLISITLHRENGEDGRAKINIPPAKRRAATA